MENTAKINCKEMEKNPAAITKDCIDRAREPYRQAQEKFQNACTAFEKDANKKDVGADNIRKELKDRLAEVELKIKETTAKLPAASTVKGEEFESLEDELDDLSAESAKLKRRIDQIEKAKNTGNERLYLEVSEAYKNLQEAGAAASDSVRKIIMFADQWSEFFKRISEEALKVSYYGTRSGDRSFIKISEQHLGQINVKGHTCGTDEAAKIRYLSGKFNGIENTPAYRSLREGNRGMKENQEGALDQNETKRTITVVSEVNPSITRTVESPVVLDHTHKVTVDVLCDWGKGK